MDFRCTKCGESKPQTAFPKNSTKPQGHDSECLRCKRARENTPEARRAKHLRRVGSEYGVSPSEYEGLIQAQGNRCAICGRQESRLNSFGEPLPLSLDHSHAHGHPRGLLCSACNRGLGCFSDNVTRLAAAIRYLIGTTYTRPTYAPANAAG